MSKIPVATLLAFVCTAPSCAGEDLFELSLEELMQVPISGSTLLERSWQQAPSAVTVFSREQIQRLGVNYVEELMNLVPGFQRYRVSQNGMNYAYSSRGRRIAEGAYDILILIDGMTIASPRARSNAASHAFIPIANIERVEFIRGPGSAIYGSNAMMGVVNIITSKSKNELGVELGSFQFRQLSLQTSLPIESLHLDTFLQLSEDNGDRYQLSDAFTPTPIVDRDPRRETKFSGDLSWQTGHFRLRYSDNKVTGFYLFSNLSPDFNEYGATLWQAALSQTWSGRYFSSELVFAHNEDHIQGRAQALPAGALFAVSLPHSMEPLKGYFHFRSREQSLRWSQQWDQRFGQLVSGIEWHRFSTQQAESLNHFDLAAIVHQQFPVAYDADTLFITPVESIESKTNQALYMQYIATIVPNWEMTAGFRYDYYNNTGENLSPRLALVYEQSEHHHIKLLYGEAFRAPSNAELYLINSPIILGNPHLQPEEIKTSEMIWLAQWPTINWHIGVFNNQFDNAIVQVVSEQGQLLQYENRSQDSTNGLEFELTQQSNDYFLWRISAMHLNQLPENGWREAREMYSFMLNGHYGRWNASVTAVRHGAREMIVSNQIADRLMLDPYWQLDCKIIYAINETIELALQGNNLNDDEYASPPQVSTLPRPIPDRGRQWYLSVTLRY